MNKDGYGNVDVADNRIFADRESVRAFHEAALKAGGKCNGPPGVREMYHPHYYGAYIVDPVGNRIEAVCHCPEQSEEKTS